MPLSHSTVLALFAVTASGCFYMTDINERPRARIKELTTGPYTVVSEVTFSATGSEDDQGLEDLVVQWEAFSCDSDGDNCTPIGDKTIVPSASSNFTVTPAAKGSLRVVLTLSDNVGARDTDTARVPIVNQEPELALQISDNFPDPGDLGGFVLGLPVQFSANVSDPDGDPLELTWTYEEPSGAGSNPDNVTFEPVPGTEGSQELIGDVAGVWEVTVSADDGDGGVATATKPVVFAADGPPCIGRLRPNVRGGDTVFVANEPTTFAILTAADGLDAWPPLANPHPLVGVTRFRWQIASARTGGVFAPLAGHQLPELVIDPAVYAPGDHLSLRVEVDDRVGRTVACPISEPTCSADGNACNQRMTWEIEIR